MDGGSHSTGKDGVDEISLIPSSERKADQIDTYVQCTIHTIELLETICKHAIDATEINRLMTRVVRDDKILQIMLCIIFIIMINRKLSLKLTQGTHSTHTKLIFAH